MVKGWADVSSDEEDFLSEDDDIHDNEEIKAAALETMKRERAEQQAAIRAEEEKAEADAKAGKPREYQYPSGPPYTAYVGNVAYSITEWEDLANQLTAMAKDLLNLEIKIKNTRIMMDRKDKSKHRGFAYVTLETLDMLKGFMQLNDQNAMLAGRKIQVDTSVRNEPTEKRGASFRNNHNPHPRGSFRNSSNFGDNSNANKPPGQRTRLQLAPRTKPVEKDPNSGSQSNIFGGGKARDEQDWAKEKAADAAKADTDADPKKTDGTSQEFRKPHRRTDDHRSSHKGRGGRHAGGRGRGQNDRRHSHKDNHPKGEQSQQKQKQQPATRAPAKPVVETKPAEPAAPTNKFAALGFDSDSD